MSKTYVVYHDNCIDGLCSAWLMSQALDEATYISAQYGDDAVRSFEEGSTVYIVDFSYSRDVLENINRTCDVLVLDHHKTAEEELRGLDYCIFDMEKCGSRLVLEYLADEWGIGPEPYLWLVDYVEDRDLWKWELENSREISAAMKSYPFSLESMHTIYGLGPKKLAEEGRAIMRYRRKLIELHKENASLEIIQKYIVPSVYISCPDIISEVAGELSEGYPFAACYFHENGSTVYSLRSREGGIDVSEVAKRAGGGGHKHAAGFKIKKENA